MERITLKLSIHVLSILPQPRHAFRMSTHGFQEQERLYFYLSCSVVRNASLCNSALLFSSKCFTWTDQICRSTTILANSVTHPTRRAGGFVAFQFRPTLGRTLFVCLQAKMECISSSPTLEKGQNGPVNLEKSKIHVPVSPATMPSRRCALNSCKSNFIEGTKWRKHSAVPRQSCREAGAMLWERRIPLSRYTKPLTAQSFKNPPPTDKGRNHPNPPEPVKIGSQEQLPKIHSAPHAKQSRRRQCPLPARANTNPYNCGI